MADLPDGIYPHLSDAEYFGADRLGSTDMSVLATRPHDWWYGSRHNPDRPARTQTDEMAFGSGLHALLLEGEAAYAATCCIRPDHYPDAKTGELKPWHGAATYCKDWLAQHQHQIVLSSDADRRIRHMAALIRNHPELGPVMDGGMPEVAVLWTDESGVKLRAKFDLLLPRFVMDLKTVGGDAKGLGFTQQVLSLVAQRNMDVQRWLYWQARQVMSELPIHGASAKETAWLKRVAEVDDWQWVWCFYRRRDDERGYAPIVKPIVRSHGDVTFESGRRKVEAALQNYQAFMARFGTEIPWAIVEAAEEPEDHAFPAWMGNVNEPMALPEAEQEAA